MDKFFRTIPSIIFSGIVDKRLLIKSLEKDRDLDLILIKALDHQNIRSIPTRSLLSSIKISNHFIFNNFFKTGEGNKMATNQTKLNRSIVDLLNFAGDTVSNNLIVASRQKIVEISENDLRKVRAIVNNSIQQSLTNGYGGVEKLINEIASVEEKTTKSKKRTRK